MNALLSLAFRAAILMLTAVWFAGLPTAPAEAATRRVDNQVSCSDLAGTPYCTIGAAVSMSDPGDTVSVADGSYTGRVSVTRSGTSSAPIVITTSERAIVKSSSQGFDLSGVSWVTVDGFTVDHTVNEGFRCTLCSDVTLSNNKVTNSAGSGIYINNSSNTELFNNKIADSLLTGIDIAGSNNIRVLGGYVTRSGLRASGKVRNGIRFSAASASLVNGTQVYDNSDIGVYVINASTGIRIKRVIAHHNARAFERIAAGIEFRSGGNIAESCISYQNEDSGINMRWGGADGLMVNNVTYLNGDHGIDVLDSPRPVIVNNTIYKNVTSGINIEGTSAGGYVYNNISIDNALNTTRKKGNINIAVEALTLGADYNLVSACCGSVLYFYQGTYNSLSALRAAHPGVEQHGIQANPAWVSAATNDFHLGAGSAAIDSAKSNAITTPEINHDVEGNARCDNSATANTGSGPISYMDRGAYEHANGCGATDTTAPSVPLNLAGSAVSPTQINLTWDESTDDVGVTGYKLYRNGNPTPVATVTGTSYNNTGLTANTTYGYRVAAHDAAGNELAQSSPALSLTTPPVSTAIVWEGRVSANSDDAEEAVGGTTTDLGSTDLELVRDDTNPHLQLVGVRFANLTIPKNAVISNAYIQFATDETSSEATSVSFAGQAINSSPAFTTADNNISARAKTAARVSWSPAAWTVLNEAGAKQRTPNLSPLIQEIVNRTGWASGNALSIIVDGTGKRVAKSRNISATNAPLLHVEYSAPGS